MMLGPSGGGILLFILLVFGGVMLAAALLTGLVLVAIGRLRKERRQLARAGVFVLAVWVIPAAAWGYYIAVATERDRYRTLERAEVVYGVPLPAGTVVNYRRWERRVHWATLSGPQTIGGVEYMEQVNFCGSRVCRGKLARDQEVDGMPCRGEAEVAFSESTGRITGCTLARPFAVHGVTWPSGTEYRQSFDRPPEFALPAGAEPVRIYGMLVHSGLVVQFTADGRLEGMTENLAQNHADTRVEAGGAVVRLEGRGYTVTEDGWLEGGVLVEPAMVDGVRKEAGAGVRVRLDGR